jgi:hypothetical protein
MKKAVIAVGSHYVGKSKTINEYLKSKLGITKRARIFILNNQDGYILSQSFEEADRAVDDVINNYSEYDLLVLAARPAHENPSSLEEAKKKLTKAGYRVSEVIINKNTGKRYYDNKAEEMLKHLQN